MDDEAHLQDMYTSLKRLLKSGKFFSLSQEFLKMKKLLSSLSRSANEGNVGKNWRQLGIGDGERNAELKE